MSLLIVIVLLLIILAKIVSFRNTSISTQKKFLIFTGIIIVVVFSIRNAEVDIGSDLNNYYRLYCRAIESSSLVDFLKNNPFEKGYLLLNWILSRLIKWPQFILLFQSAFCISITFRFIYRYSNNMFMSVLGFMSFGLMQFYLTGFRQSIAIAICLLALEMAEKRKLLSFIVFSALAISIHQTSIVFIIVYVLVRIPVNKLTVLLDVSLILILSKVIPELIEFGNEVFEKSYAGVFTGNLTGGLINILIAFLILFVMVIQLKSRYKHNIYLNYNDVEKPYNNVLKITNKSAINYKFMHILIIGIGFYIMRYNALVLERISFYFTPVMFILLPQVIENGFTKESKKILQIIFILGMIFLIYWRMKNMSFIPFWL